MNVVLYTREMEPITIIDLPLAVLEFGQKEGFVRVEAFDPPQLVPMHESAPIEMTFNVVTLRFDRLRFYNRESWFVTVDDDVIALKLKPSWLPGQQAEVNQQRAIIRSLSNALLTQMRNSGYGS